jgi:hypothetical protein
MNFEKSITGKLINLRRETFTDKQTGEINTFYRVDVVGKVDGETQCLQLTCGPRALAVPEDQFKPNTEVKLSVFPRARNNRVHPSIRSLAPAA